MNLSSRVIFMNVFPRSPRDYQIQIMCYLDGVIYHWYVCLTLLIGNWYMPRCKEYMGTNTYITASYNNLADKQLQIQTISCSVFGLCLKALQDNTVLLMFF